MVYFFSKETAMKGCIIMIEECYQGLGGLVREVKIKYYYVLLRE